MFIDGLHFINAGIEDEELVEVNNNAQDDFVRLAWATGGAAWNNDVISGASGLGQTANPDYIAAFDEAFITSIGRQILDKHLYRDVVFADQPLVEVNLGGSAMGSFIAHTNTTILGSSFVSTGTTTLSTANTIVRNGNSMAGDANTLNVFKTALAKDDGDLVLNFPQSLVPDGRYVVELMFLSFEDDSHQMSVTFENSEHAVLEHYNIDQDVAKIPTGSSGTPQYEVLTQVLGVETPTVKRYAVDVTDGDGLQITLAGTRPSINGVRILKTPPPRVTNVAVKGSTWTSGAEYSFADLVARGEQLRTIATEDVDVIEIHFSTPVDLAGDALTLRRTARNSNGTLASSEPTAGSPPPYTFTYDEEAYVARWEFDDPLGDGKFAIHLTDVTGGTFLLDAEWENETSGTPDDYADDQPRPFVVGNGIEGGLANEFRFHFALLPGDYDGDGHVSNDDFLFWQTAFATTGDLTADGNGDGVVDEDDEDVWSANWTEMLPLRRFGGGDVNDDERVDYYDYIMWVNSWGETGDGDLDGDGDTDGFDFLLWQSNFGATSAWYVGNTPMAPAALVGDFAPRVMNVIISGSLSYHPAFAFDAVDGSGSQLNTVPVGAADTISIVFSENVNVSASSLVVVGLRSGNLPHVAEFDYDPLTYTATWRFEGWRLYGDQYLIALSETVTDEDGNWLDGEWTNPASTTTTHASVSEFPSGDGNPGGWFGFVANIMPGDANLDAVVDSVDYSIWQTYLAQDGGYLEGDFFGDGIVGNEDLTLWQGNEGVDRSQLALLADFDSDFDVDDDDLAVIEANADMTDATWADGDLNGDGTVDAADLDLAFAQYGLALSVVS